VEGELKQLRLASASDDIDAFVANAIDVPAAASAASATSAAAGDGDATASASAATGYRLVIARSDGHAADGLRSIWDLLRAKLGDNAAVVLGGITPAKTPLLLAAGTPAAVDAGFDAGAVIKRIAPLIGGGGGGRPTMAQAGGKNAEGIDAALAEVRTVLSICSCG
jgi:alanyl-tRNA synthetase